MAGASVQLLRYRHVKTCGGEGHPLTAWVTLGNAAGDAAAMLRTVLSRGRHVTDVRKTKELL